MIKKIFFITSIILILTFVFSLVSFAVEIEISPILEGKEYYIMKLGETQTFKASGFGWDKKTEKKIAEAKIEAVQWSFDSRFLELVENKGDSITLKAIKNRTSKLTAMGKINGKSATKTIFIVIK